MTDVDPHLPALLERRVKDLERRLRIMENAERLTNASITEGSVEVVDADDAARVEMGLLSDGHYGLLVRDANGNTRFRGDERGLVGPAIPAVPVISTAGAFSTSSGVLTPAYFLTLPEVAHEGLELHVDWTIGGADTFKLSVGAAAPLTGSTSERTVTGPTSGTAVFKWLHGQMLGTTPFGFALDVRRTAGAGSISIFSPIAWGVSPDGCTATGL